MCLWSGSRRSWCPFAVRDYGSSGWCNLDWGYWRERPKSCLRMFLAARAKLFITDVLLVALNQQSFHIGCKAENSLLLAWTFAEIKRSRESKIMEEGAKCSPKESKAGDVKGC